MSSPQQPRPQQSRRQHGKRLRIACSRCHSRKIKCDAATPACTACAKAGADCIYEGGLGPRGRRSVSRVSNTSELQQRVQELEAQLRQDRRPADLSPHRATETAPLLNGDGPQSRLFTPSQPASGRLNLARPASDRGDTETGPSLQGDCGPVAREQSPPRDLSHQVGLVSLSAGADPRYVGPSSGYFFTQLLSSAGKRREGRWDEHQPNSSSWQQCERDIAMKAFQATPCSLPIDKKSAQDLSEAYFRTIHLQYPFLHRPTHRRLIDHVYDTPSPSSTARFQVTMVLSISAIILSRRSRVDLPAAGWCAAAMDHFSKVQVEGSIHSLQCLLLMSIYAMHSSSSRFNAWSINYQCIAMVLDLGLQRDPPSTAPLSRFQREMRTRIFMVVYSLDRKLATMMGRPIGLRDEACDLRLPASIDDEALENGHAVSNGDQNSPKHIDYAIHFFRHSIMNSEIKYVLHSVRRDTPSYAYAPIRDILQWQDTMKSRLDEWLSTVPQEPGQDLDYGATLCRVQYHTLTMLLFLPTPGIPQPRTECLRGCYASSISAIRLFDQLYNKDMLIYNWSTCHAVILHAFCLLYCAAAVSQIANDVCRENVIECLRAASNILSATGEYWAGAKRTRDLLNELATKALQQGGSSTGAAGSNGQTDGVDSGLGGSIGSSLPLTGDFPTATLAQGCSSDQQLQQPYPVDPLASLFGGYDQMDFSNDGFEIGNIFADAVDFLGGNNYLQNPDFTI